MIKFLKTYENPNEERFNFPLINKEYDMDIVTYIIHCCKSLEILDSIEFLGYEYITDESKIDMSDYISSRSRKKSSKKNQTRYMHLKDSRVAELILKFKLTCKDEADIITKRILVPVPDRNGCYVIKGTPYFLMYQVVDNSTYTTRSNLVLKSMRPVSIKAKKATFASMDEHNYTAIVYSINIYKKDAPVLLFFLAKIGLKKTLEYFSLDKIVHIVDEVGDEEKNIYFQINSKLYLEVNRKFFDKYNYVRSMIFMFLSIKIGRTPIEMLYDKRFWVETIGSLGTSNKNTQYEKGLSTITFIDRIIDGATKNILKTHNINKKNSYTILRWMIGNFDELRKKDNLSLDNKRLRCNEYIAGLLLQEFNNRVDRIIALGSKATLDNIKDIFKFPGDILIQKLHNSRLLRYDDKVNDMDFFAKLKVTFKGPNSLGGNNDKTISVKYKGIDPSYLGRLDINVCGTSDPGTSAVLTPFCKTNGLYFDDVKEPDSFKYEFDKALNDEFLEEHKDDPILVTPDFTSKDTYYDYLEKSSKLNSSIIVQRYPVKREGIYIHINMPTDEDI